MVLWSIDTNNVHPADSYIAKTSFIQGAKWQQEQDKNKYSDEDVNFIIAEVWNSCEDNEEDETFTQMRKRVLDQFKKQ